MIGFLLVIIYFVILYTLLNLNNKKNRAPKFYLGITRVLENGNSNASNTFMIRVETAQLEVDPNYIDHMFLDTYAG